MKFKDIARMIAKELRVENICPLATHFHSTDPAYLDALRKAVEEAGSRIVALGLECRSRTKPSIKTAVECGQPRVDLAVTLGSPSVRQHLGAPRNVKADVELAP